ncbi:TPA: DNA phosphorothioation-dependent restriction protein DptH, partial [Acinetobacter baumannii]|nr:DNA phosphorothioation-dependent restriction protein DptH [Acinetobacter baumannii]
MSKKQYEDFLVELFFGWAEDHLKVGEKLHFKSPDDNNSLELYEAFKRRATSCIILEEEKIIYFEIKNFKVIPVLHSMVDPGYSENYISLIRDLVSGQKNDFKNSILLIIHNSSLDTLNNSSKDLSLTNNIWNPKEIYAALEKYITTSSLKDNEISKHLLNHQFDLIQADGATMFGFRELFKAVQDGKIDFNELGYLNDTTMVSWSNSKDDQIERRLNENKRLKDQIDYIFEQFPTEYKEKLIELDFSERFIDQYFPSNDSDSWKSKLDYGSCLQEQKKNILDLITFSDCKVNEGKIYKRVRENSTQKNTSASRDHHLIIEVPLHVKKIQIDLNFENGELAAKDVKFGKYKNIITGKVKKRQGKSIVELEADFDNEIQFLNIEIKRPKPKECFKFRVLLIPENTFSISSLATKFLINPRKENLILQTDESIFQFDINNVNTYTLKKSSEIIDINQYGAVNYEDLLLTEDFINFSLKNSDHILNFEIQGIVSVSSLKLPLIFNQELYSHFFDEEVNGIYNSSSSKISLLGREYKTRYEYKKFLDYELDFIEKGLLSNVIGERSQISIDELNSAYPRLAEAYRELFTYLKEKMTLLSLVSWGNDFLEIVEKLVNEYVDLINNIQTAKLLSKDEKMLVNLGFSLIDDQEYLTPFHPINLAYFLTLVNKCQQDFSNSFTQLSSTTIRRLNAEGLIPFNWHASSEHRFSYSQVVAEHPMWIEVIPQKDNLLSYTQPLVRQKTSEFVEAFKVLFSQGDRDTLLINSIHNGDNKDLFLGLIGFIKKHKQKNIPNIHVSIYDDKLNNTYFDIVADSISQKELKNLCKLSSNDADADQITDIVRRNITYSKFEIAKVEAFNYSHISFVRNNTPVKTAPVDLIESKTGIACHGLLAGETSYHEQGTYFTTAGLKYFPDLNNPAIQIVKRYSALSYSAWENQNFYESNGLSLKVTSDLQQLLEKSYEDSLWTVIIDPKVTLDFFKSQQDVVLIHYSDNYTNSSNYDAITVTKRRDLYDQILGQGKVGRIDEFNAFNGEWLLKMLTLPEKERREKASIIAAYKYVNCLLINSDITWVPLSVAEMVRISGNIGLKMSESDFSTYCQGLKYGVMSDDVLFVGFKDQQMYLLPLEVKVGQKQRHDKGIEQAKKLKGYLENVLFGRQDLVGHLYRGLFIKQIMMQVEKYQLYKIYSDNYFESLLKDREILLQGDYKLADIQGYIKGFVVAFIENDTFFQEDFTVIDNILMAKIPGPCQNKFISTPLRELLENCESEDLINIPEKFILKGNTLFKEIMVDSNTQQVDPNLISDPIGDLSEVEEITDDEALEGDDTSQLDKFGIAV